MNLDKSDNPDDADSLNLSQLQLSLFADNSVTIVSNTSIIGTI